MKPRCMPGDMAFVLSGRNAGKIVHVVRQYVENERISGVIWETGGKFCWVVESAGGLLASVFLDGTPAPGAPSLAIEDDYLKPIRPGKGTDEVLRITGKPKQREKVSS